LSGTQPEHSRYGVVVRAKLRKKGAEHETDCAYYRGDGRRFGVRNNAQDANLSRRIGDRGDRSLSASASATTASSSADGELPGWIDGPGGRDLPASTTAATSAAAGAAFGRTRLILKSRRKSAGRHSEASHDAESCPLSTED
jgi:hypothetical protein